MKTVFNNRQVCHVFVSQSQPNGRNSSSSLYFENDKIWSYGSHYCLGRIYSDKNILLVNSDGYSPTTSKQRSYLTSAASHLTCIYVPYPSNEYYIKEYNLYKNHFSPKSKDIVLNEDMRDLLEEVIKASQERQKELNKTAAERKEKRAAAEREALKEAFKSAKVKYKSGINKRDMSENEKLALNKFPPIMRVHRESGYLYTSHGAEVRLLDALRVYKMLQAGQNIIGEKITHFTVNEVTEELIKVGCHTFIRSEIENTLNQFSN